MSAAAPEPTSKPIPVEIQESKGPFDSLSSILALLIHPLTQVGIVLLMLTFFLIYREDLRNRLIRLAGTGDIHRTTTAIDEAGGELLLLARDDRLGAAELALFRPLTFMLASPGEDAAAMLSELEALFARKFDEARASLR